MADTAFFSPDVFVFLRQLKRNNDRKWFAKNKARYRTSIAEPALSFIGGFAPQLEKISPFFVADARPTRGSLFRIYRDTRFSSRQASLQDSCWHSLFSCQWQGCSCASFLSTP